MAVRRFHRFSWLNITRHWPGYLAALGALSGVAACLAAPAPAKQAAAPAAKVAPAPAPVEIGAKDLTTRDGVQLKATYYPRAEGKDVLPVLLLHAWKGSRKDYAELAPHLQSQGYAVLVPDLRGHGDSTHQVVMMRSRMKEVELDAVGFGPNDFAAMVTQDMAAIRQFLIQKNDAGELNLNKLVIVGAEMGAAVALDWSADDWSYPNYPGVKQGKDVKALVLLSPQWTFRGLNTTGAINHSAVQQYLSLMFCVGKQDPKALGEVERLHTRLSAIRREDFSGLPFAERKAKQSLWLGRFDTKLQGTKMLAVRSLNLPAHIADFINLRVVQGLNAPWVQRKR